MNIEDQWLASAQVEPDVLALRPDYAALLIVADGLLPGPSDEASDTLLASAERRADKLLAGRSPDELPQVQEWREAYRAFGAKPQRTRPSVEALLRRLPAGLPRVDRITDAYNAVSVAHLLPIGGEDHAAYAGAVRLVRARGDEPFETTKDGDAVIEHPDAGEVVWRDEAGVTCRRWNWRQCTRTRITKGTVNALFILDGLSELGVSGLQDAAQDLVGSLTLLCPSARFATRLIAG